MKNFTKTALLCALLATTGATWAASSGIGTLTNPLLTDVSTIVTATDGGQISWTDNQLALPKQVNDKTILGSGGLGKIGCGSYTCNDINAIALKLSDPSTDACHGLMQGAGAAAGKTIKVVLGATNVKTLVNNDTPDICRLTGTPASSYNIQLLTDGQQTVAPGKYSITLSPVYFQ